MIVSHRYRFIFLKTTKTAGTSIEIALSKYLGDDDIITPISAVDEKIRSALGFRGPQNFKAPFSAGAIPNPRHPRLLMEGFQNHMPARHVRMRIGEKVWHSYFKFCVERNPWARLASYYNWVHRKPPGPGMRAFIESGATHMLREYGWYCYSIDDRVAVNRICKFETLAAGLEVIRKRIGLPEPLALPHAKRGPGVDYRTLYGTRERDQVAKIFAREIREFGYSF